jgi:hypothetical protein
MGGEKNRSPYNIGFAVWEHVNCANKHLADYLSNLMDIY